MIPELKEGFQLTLNPDKDLIAEGDTPETLFTIRKVDDDHIRVGWEGEDEGTYYTIEEAEKFFQEGAWIPYTPTT